VEVTNDSGRARIVQHTLLMESTWDKSDYGWRFPWTVSVASVHKLLPCVCHKIELARIGRIYLSSV